MVCHRLFKFDWHRFCRNRCVLVYHVIMQYHLIKASCKYNNGDRHSKVVIGTIVVEI